MLLSACGSAATASQPGAANPVAILRETGATPDPGTVYGSHDVYGDRYASGSFPGDDTVAVYTCSDQAAFEAEEARPPSDDSHGVVTIPGKLAVIAVDAAENGWTGLTPQQIASAVHGLVTGPQA